MTFELIMPRLGVNMEEGTITRWAKSEGDWVETGEVVLEIETDKVSYEIEAPGAGYLHILHPKGAHLAVGTQVGLLFEDKTAYESLAASTPSAKAPEAVEAEPFVPATSAPLSSAPQVAPKEAAERVKASPLARKIALENDVDLDAVVGTGPGGRIVRDDLLRHLQQTATSKPSPAEGPPPAPPTPATGLSTPIEGMRRQIFEHMHQSVRDTAQMTITAEVDASELVRLRDSLMRRYEKEGVRMSYNAILLRILGLALKEHLGMNVRVENNQIIQSEAIHIGVAMELDEGLIVPVVRNADMRSFKDIEEVLQDLFQRARNHKLLLDEIQGGTFTLTNLGELGVDAFTPILNSPESGILGVGRIVKKAVVSLADEDHVEVGARMVLSLTFDHRIINGAPAARFLRRVAEMIEDPYVLVT